jgi:hypothetical protein
MLHGEAVALGICWEALLSRRLGVASPEVEESVFAVLRDAGYLLDDPTIPVGALSSALGMDKKRSGGDLVLPLVDEPGKCILMSVPVARVRDELPAVRAILRERLGGGSGVREREPRESVVGDPARVVGELEAAVSADPRDVRALRLLADAYRRAGRVRSAWETVKEALARDPGHGGSQALAREIRASLDEGGGEGAAFDAPPAVLEGTLLIEDEVIEIGPGLEAARAGFAPPPAPAAAPPPRAPAPPEPDGGGEDAPPVRTVTVASLYWSQGNRGTAQRIIQEILRENPGDDRARAWLAERSLPVPAPPAASPPHVAAGAKAGPPSRAPGKGRAGGTRGAATLSSFLRKIAKEYDHEIS